MAIKSGTIEKYQTALKSLLGKLSQSDFTEYAMSDLIKEHKLFPGLAGILVSLNWIEKRSGKGKKTEYRAKKSWKDVDPIHVKAVIKAVNNYNPKKKVQKQQKIVSTGVIAVLNELIKEAEGLGQSTVKIVYRHKYNPLDTLESLGDAFKKGIKDLTQYEEHKIINSPRSLFISKITNGQTLSQADIKTAQDFARILTELNREDATNGFTARCKYHTNKLAKTESPLERVQLIDDICMLYIKYKRTPGTRFLYTERYKQLLKENI